MEKEVIMEVQNLKKYFPVRTRALRLSVQGREQRFLKAVDGLDFRILKGDIFALAGESGCGKTTTGKLLSLLESPTAGSILFRGADTTKTRGAKLKEFRRQVQMIFQDPYESLDPRYTVLKTVSEPLDACHIGSTDQERIELVSDILCRVGLEPAENFLNRYPSDISGGQRQRVAIARAMVLHPAFVVADEPVSMLDVSIRATVLNMMLRLSKELDVTYLFITHDLTVARYMSNKMAIMYLGKTVEIGATEDLIARPHHPYTNLLMASVPVADPSHKREGVTVTSEIPNPVDAPSGCKFHPRCPKAVEECSEKIPELVEISQDHLVACHKY